MKPEDIRKMIDEGLFSAGDAVNTLGPGGSMDRLLFTTSCKNCGVKVEQPLRWFHEREARCPCGGEYNMEPLKEAILGVLRGDSAFPDCLRMLPERKQEGGGEN